MSQHCRLCSEPGHSVGKFTGCLPVLTEYGDDEGDGAPAPEVGSLLRGLEFVHRVTYGDLWR